MSNPNQVLHEPTVRDLVGELLSGGISTLRENKLATVLAVFACVLSTLLAYNIRYDERPRYREEIAPELLRAESNFTIMMDNADRAPNEAWRLNYFLTAHGKIKDVLRVAHNQFPVTAEGLAAHQDFIRYYDLLNEDLAILRTQMSVDEKMDYWAEWKRLEASRQPIRDQWLKWVDGRGEFRGRSLNFSEPQKN